MSNFRPIRASSPMKPVYLAPNSETSRSSSARIIPELAHLTQDDVQFIDAVIHRAGPSATSFTPVFKAYNEELDSRGIDTQDEVVYYGKLLKIGTLPKGKNWEEKWNIVKKQHGYTPIIDASRPTRKNPITKPSNLRDDTPQASPQPRRRWISQPDIDDDTFTLHSHQDDAVASTSGAVSRRQVTSRRPADRTPRSTRFAVPSSKKPDVEKKSFPSTVAARQSNLDSKDSIETSKAPIKRLSAITSKMMSTRSAMPAWNANLSSSFLSHSDTETVEDNQPTSPPYTSVRTSAYTKQYHALPTTQAGVNDVSKSSLAPKPRSSLINEEEAWGNIKMARDEADADAFRNDKLVERCWTVWKQGISWIHNTNGQIDHARNMLILRMHMHHWRVATSHRTAMYAHVSSLADQRLLRRMLVVWRQKLSVRRQASWREDMRTKLHQFRTNCDNKRRDAFWLRWRRHLQYKSIGHQYDSALVSRCFGRWRERLAVINGLEEAARQFDSERSSAEKLRVWAKWVQALRLREAEKAVSAKVQKRNVRDALLMWRMRLQQVDMADNFAEVYIMKQAISRWRKACIQTKSLEVKADKYVQKKDGILLRAVMRVWRAHLSGQQLERIRTLRVAKHALSKWKDRIAQHRQAEELAIAFTQRPAATTIALTFQKWHSVLSSYLKIHQYAADYSNLRLQARMLLVWRLQLRSRIKLLRQAKLADKHFQVRRFLLLWKEKMAERKREQNLVTWNKMRCQRIFQAWLKRTRHLRTLKAIEQDVVTYIEDNIRRRTLLKWTNRVIDIKLRELDVTQSYASSLLATTFLTWKQNFVRRREESSLLRSYEDIRREETLRRVFHKWLSAARKSVARKQALIESEEEMKQRLVVSAWDQWRGAFITEKLRPIERTFILQNEKAILFKAFGIWYSKTKSLPAIRFRANHLKAKVWAVWRGAMPRALEARKAKDFDRKAVLSKAFARWVESYQTKIALKAVARARYLSFPTNASNYHPVTGSGKLQVAAPGFNRRDNRQNDSEGEEDPEKKRVTEPTFPSRKSTVNPFNPPRIQAKKSTQSSTAVPARDSSPTRSQASSRASEPVSRSKLLISRSSRTPGSGSLLGKTLSKELSSASLMTKPSNPLLKNRERNSVKDSISVTSPKSKAEPETGRSRLWSELRDLKRRPTTGIARSETSQITK